MADRDPISRVGGSKKVSDAATRQTRAARTPKTGRSAASRVTKQPLKVLKKAEGRLARKAAAKGIGARIVKALGGQLGKKVLPVLAASMAVSSLKQRAVQREKGPDWRIKRM